LYPDLNWNANKFKVVGIDWKSSNVRRSFFDQIAKELGVDPLIPTQWFSVSTSMILPFKGAINILKYYNNKISNALVDLYPNVCSNVNFIEEYRLFRKYHTRFTEFAKESDFDPLVPENWYSIGISINNIKGIAKLLEYFDGDLGKALQFIFPNIGLDRDIVLQNQNTPVQNKPRKLFDEFAEKNGFDPLLAENWYRITRSKILSMKGSETILSQYGSSLSRTVAQMYPDIGVDVTKFKFMQKQYWSNVDNQRTFFIDMAKEKGFDPLVKANWYSCSYWDIQGQKKASSILTYYNGNYKKALITVFADLGLEESKFV